MRGAGPPGTGDLLHVHADKPPSGIFERNSRGATPYALKQQLLLHLYLADLHDGLILGRNVGKDFGRVGPKRSLERLRTVEQHVSGQRESRLRPRPDSADSLFDRDLLARGA